MDWKREHVVRSDWMLDIRSVHGSSGQTANDAGRYSLKKKTIPFLLHVIFRKFNYVKLVLPSK